MSDPEDPIAALVGGPPIVVDEKLTLRSVAAVLSEADVGAVLVQREGGPLAVVSERDVARALADDADPDTVWSADVAAGDLVAVDADDPVLGVALRMLEEGIRHVVVQRDGEIVGVVSSRDVFAVLAGHALTSR